MRSFGIVFGLGIMTIIAAGAVAAALPLPLPFLQPFSGNCTGSVAAEQVQLCGLGQHGYTHSVRYTVTPGLGFGGSIGVTFSLVPESPAILPPEVHLTDFNYGCDIVSGTVVACVTNGPPLQAYVEYNISCHAFGNPGGSWACAVQTA